MTRSMKVNPNSVRVSKKDFVRGKKVSIMSIFGILLVCLLLNQITLVNPAHALTRYYNCLARVANKNATLSISNVNACYDMIFKGALDYYGIKQNPILNSPLANSQDTSEKNTPHSRITNDPSQAFEENRHVYDVFR